MVHEAASSGFGSSAAAYERGRPGYPDDAVRAIADHLDLAPGRRVLDLAAGTGKLTERLVLTGATVVAVEPVDAMRATLTAKLPTVEALPGTAEAIPLPDSSVDGATVAQAFHWFDRERALAELHRVLRPGGGLALVWNHRDERVPWVAEISRLTGWSSGQIPVYDRGVDWAGVLRESARFDDVETRTFHHEQPLDADLLVDRVLSISYLATKPAAEQAELARQVRGLVADLGESFAMPYRVDVHLCRRG
jgi:SAM-dependent methyltransferase